MYDNYIDNAVLSNDTGEEKSIYRTVANVSFFVFLFFAFFNTNLPFQARITEVDEISTSNKINQILYTLLFLASLFSLLPKKNEIIRFIKTEKFLSLFLAHCLFSVFWSDYSFVSFKRYFQFITIVAVILAFLLHNFHSSSILKPFKIILSLYVILSFLSVLFVSGAIDPTCGTWRGLTQTKNLFGQAALMNIFFWSLFFRDGKWKEKIFALVMLFISLVLLIGSASMTSILAFLIILCLVSLFSFENKYFYQLGVGRTFSVILFSGLCLIFIGIYHSAPEMVFAVPEYFGKEITFTGRTELWLDILNEAKQHLLLGAGFEGFWVIGNPNLHLLYEKYIWLPNQAHNGYLDILNETGVLGLLIFLLAVIFYFINFQKLKSAKVWHWFFIAALIINAQESTLFKTRHPSGILMIFSYLAFYVEYSRQKINNEEKESTA